eukprot:4592926-Lingulodinium_polyedra.AAC.1
MTRPNRRFAAAAVHEPCSCTLHARAKNSFARGVPERAVREPLRRQRVDSTASLCTMSAKVAQWRG